MWLEQHVYVTSRKFTIIVGHVCAIVNNFSTTSFITKDEEEEEEFNELF